MPAVAANALPADWTEVLPADSAHPDDPVLPNQSLSDALHRLQTTHPGRYDRVAPTDLTDKMGKRRDTKFTYKVRGARIFVYKTTQIAVMYFVRLRNTKYEEAYCMTVGVDDNVITAAVLYAQLKAICQFMQREPGGDYPGGSADPKGVRLEIVNSERHLDHGLGNNAAAIVCFDAYRLAKADGKIRHLANQEITPTAEADVWFPLIHRWVVNKLP